MCAYLRHLSNQPLTLDAKLPFFASHYPLTRSSALMYRAARLISSLMFALMNGCIATGELAGNVNFYYKFVDGLTKRVALYLDSKAEDEQEESRRRRVVPLRRFTASAHYVCVCASACLHASKSHPANQRHCQTATTCPSSLPPSVPFHLGRGGGGGAS